MINLKCDSIDICAMGDFDCNSCLHKLKGNKPKRQPAKKPKQKIDPPKQYKRRKK